MSTSNVAIEAADFMNELCYICGGPVVDGACPAYNWNDKVHLANRARLNGKKTPEVAAPVIEPDDPKYLRGLRDMSKLCAACGAPLDADGVNCTDAPYHDAPVPGMEGYFDHLTDPEHWHWLFHSRQDALNAPPVTFLINGFLQREGVTAIAAPVRERKSLIALNIVHSLLTGNKLFDHFEVVKRPERVLYLCPEVSLGPFTDRIRKIGLLDYVGRTFFYRTLSTEGHLKLDDTAFLEALPGSMVVLDTAIRFLEGDENSSKDVRAFADSIFLLLRSGAEAVLLLHHSPKDMGDSMTLESAMRGSGDMGAFLACCWGTRLQDPSDPYKSASFLSNLKQRDFESRDFEVTCGEDCRMHIVGDPATTLVKLASRVGNRANKDGFDTAAIEVIRANMDMPIRKLQERLAELNISRGTNWIARTRARLKTESAQE